MRTRSSISMLLALLGLTTVGNLAARCGSDPCAILESSDAALLSGPGEIALRHHCGELPTTGEVLATAAQPPLPPSPAAAAFGVDVQVNAIPDPGASTTQSEVSMAETGGVLVSGWNDSSDFFSTSSFNGYAVSTDGGASWTDRGALPPMPLVTSANFGDPWIRAHHATGNFYYASLADNSFGRSIVAVYTGSTPGIVPDWPSATDVTPGQPGGTFEDKQAMDVDNSGGPFDGRVYVCWRQFGGTDNIKLSINDTIGVDAPLAHVGISNVSAPGRASQGCFVEVDQSSGDVYVAWEDLVGARTVRVRRSPAGGLAFGAEAVVATFANVGRITTCPFCPGRQVVNGDIRVMEFISSMAVNSVTGNIHVVYAADGAGPDDADVFHVRCSPAGPSSVGACTAPFRLNSDATTTDQWHPYIDASPTGNLAIFWYDRRNDPDSNLLIDLYKRFSTDDGVTFTPDERVTDVSFSVPPLCPNFDPILRACYMGEYNHVISDASGFQFVWSDNRNLVGGRPDPDIFFESETINEPPDCSGAAPNPDELWPPHHDFADVSVFGVTDPDGDPVTITIASIFQDEPVNDVGDGNTTPDGGGLGTETAQVRRERTGSRKVPGDGRTYTIGFVAMDDKGGQCAGEVTVCVPHDQRALKDCVDQGPLFDSTITGGAMAVGGRVEGVPVHVAEIDPGVSVMLPVGALPPAPTGSSHLTGFDVAIDLTHNTGRQSLVTTGYNTIQGDLTSHGASLTFVNTGPLTLPLLSRFPAWWIEEDFSATYAAAEIDALGQYVDGGGCVFLNGDNHDATLYSFFDVPYAGRGGAAGFTSDITPHFLTNPFPPSPFPGAVSQLFIPAPAESLAPVPPAFDVVRDLVGNPMVAVNRLGAGGVVVFSDELTLDNVIPEADNRTLANRAFEFCAFGLNQPPDCGNAEANPDELWSPNHQFEEFSVSGITDPDGDPITVTVTAVFQDEPQNGLGDGDSCPDVAGVGTGNVTLRSERSGTANGRIYHVGFTAEDGEGGACSGEVTVCVPHDQGSGSQCIDGGPLFDSEVCD